jgi:hypothetical protein
VINTQSFATLADKQQSAIIDGALPGYGPLPK